MALSCGNKGVLALAMTVLMAMVNMMMSLIQAACWQACCVVSGVFQVAGYVKKEWLRTERMLSTVMHPRGTGCSRGRSSSNPAASLGQKFLEACLTLWVLAVITLLTCSRLGLRVACYLGASALPWGPVGWSLRAVLSCANGMVLAPIIAYKTAAMGCNLTRSWCKKTLHTAPDIVASLHCVIKATLLLAVPCAVITCIPLYIGYVMVQQLCGRSPKLEDTETVLMNMPPVVLLVYITGYSDQSASNITRTNSQSLGLTVNIDAVTVTSRRDSTDVASRRGSSNSSPSTPTGTRSQVFLQLPTEAAEHWLVSAPVSPSAPAVPRRRVQSSSSSGSASSRSASEAGFTSVADSTSPVPEPAAFMVLWRFIDGRMPLAGWSC